jgi:hypothetical protein
MSALTDALNSYMSGDFIDGRTAAYINISANIASGIAIGIAGLVMAWDYFKNSLLSFDDGREGKLFDPYVLGKIIFFLFIIQAYPYTIKPVLNYFNEINQSYAKSSADYDQYQMKLEHELIKNDKSKDQIISEASKDPDLSSDEKSLLADTDGLGKAHETEEKSLWRAMKDGISGMAAMVADPRIYVSQVFHWLANILIFIIRPVVKLFTFYSVKLMTVLGPFAIAFSLLPGFSGQFAKWFGRLANLLFAGIMFTILDALFIDTFSELFMGAADNSIINNIPYESSEGWTYMFNVIGFDLAVVALYVSPFFLSSAIIGSGDGGAMVSKAISIGTTAATLMTTAATGGASAIVTAATGVPVNLGGKGGGGDKNPLKHVD